MEKGSESRELYYDGASPDEPLIGKDATSGEHRPSGHYWVFHLVMFTASMYMAMVLTNWRSPSDMSRCVA